MKKFARILLLASLCSAVGCDTEVATDEITEILTPETRCGMSGGIPLSSSQIAVVKDLVNKTNQMADDQQRNATIQGIWKSFGYAGVNDVTYGSEAINMLYQYAYTQPIGSKDEMYCACGTEVCDKGIGCGETNGSYSCTALNVEGGTCSPVLVETRYFAHLLIRNLLPIIQVLRNLRESTKKIIYFDDDSTRKDGWSEISKLIKNPRLNILVKSKRYADYLNVLKNIDDDNPDFSDLPTIVDKEENDDDNEKIKDKIYATIGAIVVFAAIAECTNGATENCPKDPKELILHLDGSSKSTNPGVPQGIYQSIRVIAANRLLIAGEFDRLIKTGLIDSKHENLIKESSPVELANLSGDDYDSIAAVIDQFIIDQIGFMLNTHDVNLDNLLMNETFAKLIPLVFKNPQDPMAVSVKINPDCEEFINSDENKDNLDEYDCKINFVPSNINNKDAAIIIDTLKALWAYSYSSPENSVNSKVYEAHRKFFAEFILKSMSPEDRRRLYDMTFTQTNKCSNHESPTGQKIGINQYCSGPFFQSNIFTFGSLASAVLGDTDAAVENSCDLADGIIMDRTFTLQKSSGENLFTLQPDQIVALGKVMANSGMNLPVEIKDITEISISSVDIYLGDDRGANPLTVRISIKTNNGTEIPLETTPTGTWISYRCPMGASCTENNECGQCSNTEVPHNYGLFSCATLDKDGQCKSELYDNAICTEGVLKNVDNSTQSTEQ